MNSFKIAFQNFKRNVKMYGIYVVSMIFSVMVYYNMVAIKYNPDFQKANNMNEYIRVTSASVSYLMLLLLLFFIWFSTSFFLKQRKKEIGIYAFMGVSNTQIGFIYAIEVLFIGMASVAAGLLLGVIFNKLFLMMLAKVSLLNMTVRFSLSTETLLETGITFIVIFFLNSLLGYINIARSKLIDLFHASNREEQLPKANYVKGILAVILIGTGYYLITHATGSRIFTYIPFTIAFVVIGTYWLLGSAFSVLMRFLLHRKKLLYNGINIVSYSNIAFRIKNNYRALAAVAILAAVALTSYGTVASLRYFVEIRDSIQVPFDLSYISADTNVKQAVRDKLKEKKNDITLEENTKFLRIQTSMESDFGKFDEETIGIKYSDFLRISNDLKTDIEPERLSKNEVLYVETPTVVISLVEYKSAKLMINEQNYTIKEDYKTPLFGNGLPAPCVVLSDEDYNTLMAGSEEYEFNGIKINSTDDIKALAADLQSVPSLKDSLFVNTSKDTSTYSLFGIIYFLGAFLALVAIAATGSIIYFKLVSEAYIDKNKYSMLKKLGMTKKEAVKAVSKQIGISYVLPLVVGIMHSCVAIYVLSEKIHYPIIVPAITSILTFIVIYGLYFIATTRKYIKTVW
ncbi:ABC transporter permease [Bacillaceae bacterium Marseille-Q3522]|nr:ABC transporter permease [Bacillaceae bacterium Marseille-Q3522]